MNDLEGEPHKVSDYLEDNKLVLLDFWASWCGPCRAEIPNLKDIYATYHSKGLEIISISLDDNTEAWSSAVKDLDMPWVQLSDCKGWNNKAAQLYNVSSIPYMILFNNSGKVVASQLRGEALKKKVKNILATTN
jgi:thiol-disulfide isomerase/thioredoxin